MEKCTAYVGDRQCTKRACYGSLCRVHKQDNTKRRYETFLDIFPRDM